MIFKLVCGRKFSGEQIRQQSVYVSELSTGLIVAPWKFNILKTNIFVLRMSMSTGQL